MDTIQKESRLRSIIKAVTWRLLATGTTFCLAYMVFRESPNALEKSTIVAALELVIKLLFYYLHERLWQNVPRGRIRSLTKRFS